MRRTARHHGGGYTWFVRLAKIFLPVAALVMVGIVAARLSKQPLQQVEMVPARGKTAPGAIELVKAQYEGVDERGRPYTLIAERASRALDADETVLMEGLKADITLEDKSWLAVQAQVGTYAVKLQRLSLTKDVSVYHDSGYEMHLDDLDIDMKTRSALSVHPVRAQGPSGEIEAQGVEVTNAGDRVVFTGPIKLTLYHLGDAG